MLTHTKQTIHIGVGCVFTPQPVLDPRHMLLLQAALTDHGLIFSQTNFSPTAVAFQRQEKPLELRVLHAGNGIGSVVVIAPAPWATSEIYLDEARIAFAAYSEAWPSEHLQIIQREATLRQLYDVPDEHAFKFLWERRLQCTESELQAFRRPVLGGGLRFMIPPRQPPPYPEADEPLVEVRIESSFSNPKKLFVEVQMKWMTPLLAATLDPEPILREIDRFAGEEVVDFITGATA